MRRAVLSLLLMPLFVVVEAPLHAAASGRDCIEGSVVLPLLGGAGDAPIIAVQVEGRDAALFVSPDFDGLFLNRSEAFHFVDTAMMSTVTTNDYHVTRAPVVKITDLKIGSMDLGEFNAVRLDDYSASSLNGRPVIGVLGFRRMTTIAVLLNVSAGKIAFLKIGDSAACNDAARQIMGANAQSLPLRDDVTIPVKIDGQERWLATDTDLSVTALPAAWDDLPEVKDATSAARVITMTRYGRYHTKGIQTRLKNFKIANKGILSNEVIIQHDIGIGMLGLNFFSRNMALWDFPRGRFYFSQTAEDSRPGGGGLHFDRTQKVETAVQDKVVTMRAH